MPFVLCCDLFHAGFTYATSWLSEFRLSKKWRSFKDLWCGYIQNKIPVNQSAKPNKTLKFALILLILCLLLFLFTYYGNFGAISNFTTDIPLNFNLKISSGMTTIWSWCAALLNGTAGLVASGYYSLTTLLSSNNNIQIQHSKRMFHSNEDINGQVETALNLLMTDERFAKRIKEWAIMDETLLKEVLNRIDIQEHSLTKMIDDHKRQTDDQQKLMREHLEQTKTTTEEKLSALSNSNFPSINSQIDLIEQKLSVEQSREGPIFEKLQSEITEIKDQLVTLKEEYGNYSETITHRKTDILSKLEEFEARLNNIVSEQAQLSQTISSCSNAMKVDTNAISDDNLLKDRISKTLNDIFNENLSNSDNQESDLPNKYISQLNALVSESNKMLTKDQLQEQLASTFSDWKKGVLDEIQPHVSDSIAKEITKNQQLKETVEMELNNILEHRKMIMNDNKEIIETDSAQFSEEDVSRIVKTELVTYDADKTGKFDFALESAGGTILSTRCTQTYDAATAVYSIWGIPVWWESVNGPRAILQPGANPGQCWAVKGDGTGFTAPPISVVIELSDKIIIDSVTLEHIPETLSPDGNIKSAPKEFSVLGLSDINDPNPVVLGNFTYVIGHRPVQTFKINPSNLDDEAIINSFSMVELKVLSNYGNPVYTCIYRFRVHGNLTPSAKTSFR